MPSLNVDLVFVIDASQSMRPCFDALRTHLDEVIQPMQGYVSKVRFGLVAQSVLSVSGQVTYDHHFLCGSGIEAIKKLYQKDLSDPDPRNEFFTDDSKQFATALAALKPQGNEEMLVALDVAADFPFGPLSNTKRVIALFSDERFEGGKSKGSLNSKIPALSKKLMDRHIQLFVAIPDSPAIQELAMVDRSEVELVDGGNGLKGLDFKQLLAQMGKSISGSSMQAVGEPTYQRAIFGQDSWRENETAAAEKRDEIVKEDKVGHMAITAQRLGVLIRTGHDTSLKIFTSPLVRNIQKNFPEAIIRYSDEQIVIGDARCSSDLLTCGDSDPDCGDLLARLEPFPYCGTGWGHNFNSIVELVNSHGCDGIYWICDLDYGGTKYAIRLLSELLLPLNVKLYVRSRVNGPDSYPGLLDLIKASGGDIEIGPFESHELLPDTTGERSVA